MLISFEEKGVYEAVDRPSTWICIQAAKLELYRASSYVQS